MKIAVLETGSPPDPLKSTFGGYPDMMREMIGPEAADWTVYDVRAERYPDRVDDHEAYVITGSPSGVYDGDQWIDTLEDFLRDAKGRARLVGVCFGHQIMAQAFGGEVRKSEKGWGVGLHRYDVIEPQSWMGEAPPQIAVPVSHQDQVVAPPPAVTVLAASPFTPYAMLAYADQPAVSMQFHPEFDPDYAAALVERRRGERLTDAQADEALASLRTPNDRALVAEWVRRFLGL